MYCANLGCWQTENCLLHQTLGYDSQSDESSEGDEVNFIMLSILNCFQENWQEVYSEKVFSDDEGCYYELTTYGGGPVGGYRLRCTGLCTWHLELSHGLEEKRVSGVLFRRHNKEGIVQVKHE